MKLRSVHLTGKKRPGIHRPSWWMPRKRCSYSLFKGGWEWLIVFTPFKGRACHGVRPRGTTGLFAPLWILEDVDVERRKIKGGGGPGGGPTHLAAVETILLERCPRIVEHLTVTRYTDGEPRRVGLLMVDTQGTTWRVRLTEPDAPARLTCLGETLDDAFALAELHLASQEAPWEVDTYAQSGKKKK